MISKKYKTGRKSNRYRIAPCGKDDFCCMSQGEGVAFKDERKHFFTEIIYDTTELVLNLLVFANIPLTGT